MAIQLTNYVKGRLGNVVFYERSGIHIARTLPVSVKQAPATRIRSRNFGIAATAGRVLRELLTPVLPFPKDKRMQSRFSGAIAKWLRQDDPADIAPSDVVPYVNDFSFSESTTIAERWKTSFKLVIPSSGSVQITIPSFIPVQAIAAPAYTVQVKCRITVASYDLLNGQAPGNHTVEYIIPYNDIPQESHSFTCPVATQRGVLLIAAVSLRYVLSSGIMDERPAFMPASVVGARWV